MGNRFLKFSAPFSLWNHSTLSLAYIKRKVANEQLGGLSVNRRFVSGRGDSLSVSAVASASLSLTHGASGSIGHDY
jgi:hypothetical protein